jgi:thiamine kinase-like enzyme
VKPRGYQRDGFEVTLWTYYETVTPHISAVGYAQALTRLHASMRTIDVPTPHFTDRVADVPGHIASTHALDDADRQLLSTRLRDLRQAVQDHGAPEQLLHGEPHPGNVLSTKAGPVFIDLETCCRGPVEFDLAHVPAAVSQHYPDADPALLEDCRGLVLAVVAKHRCDPDDQFPDGPRALRDLLAALRAGPPWPPLDVVMRTR